MKEGKAFRKISEIMATLTFFYVGSFSVAGIIIVWLGILEEQMITFSVFFTIYAIIILIDILLVILYLQKIGKV